MFGTRNLEFIVLIITGLLLAAYGYYNVTQNGVVKSYTLIDAGLWISEIAGLFMLVLNGTFIKTRYFKLAKLGIAIILIGALFKILHWSGRDLVFIIGFAEIAIVYIISFIHKPIKKRLDYLKLIWVITAITVRAMKFLHYISDDYYIIPFTIMWLLIIDYGLIENKKKTLFK